jgi:hypothetical protein
LSEDDGESQVTEDQKEILKVGMDATIKPFSNLLEKLFGGSVEEIGGMWQDELQVRRLGRRLKLYKHVQTMFAEAGIEPKQIPDKIWIPALQAASAEDDEGLQEKWAALLTNASIGDLNNEMLPSFPDILKQLTPVEAQFLDRVYNEIVEDEQARKEAIRRELPGCTGEPSCECAARESTLALATPLTIRDLERLGLLTRDREGMDFTSNLTHHTSGVANHLYVSSFGRAFIHACRAPQTDSLESPER